MGVVELVLLAAAIGISVYSYYQTREAQNRKPQAGRISVPTVGEGVPWKVVFGDCEISDPHVMWHGNARTVWWEFIHNYLYYISIQLGLCHGKVDEILELTYGDVPVGSFPVGFTADGGGVMHFGNFPKALLQGLPDDAITWVIDSVKWRAGVTMGAVNTAGTVDAGARSYVGDQLGMSLYPRHYGIATVTLEDILVGTNPYLSTLSMRVRRNHWRNGGADAQWYDEKVEIISGKGREDFWKYRVYAPEIETIGVVTEIDYDDSGWSVGRGGFGNNRQGSPTAWVGAAWNSQTYNLPRVLTQLPGGDGVTNSPEAADAGIFWVAEGTSQGAQVWLRADLGALPAVDIPVQCWHDDNGILFFNETEITLTSTEIASDTYYGHFNSSASIPASLINPSGPNVIAYGVMDSWTWPHFPVDSVKNGLPKLIYAGIAVGVDGEQRMSRVNMNAVHAIRECYTDTIWGKGLPDAKMGDTWTAAADTCYTEKLGVSLEWDGGGDVDQLIAEFCRHISAVTYPDPVTGKIEIKLLRDDYTVGELPVFDASNVVRVADIKNKTTGTLVNKLTVGFSATPGGDTASITVQDDGLIDLQGGIKAGTVEYKAFTDAISAGRAGWRDLQVMAGPYRAMTVYTNRDGGELRPGGLFVLNKPELGIVNAVMRINDIELGDSREDEVRITCMDDVFALPAISPIGPGGPISHPPPGRTPGLALDNISFWTALMFDPRNEGMVECCYLTTYFEASNWVQTSPGILEWDLEESMPVWSLGFDGVEPNVYAEGGSPMLGATIFIGEGSPSSATRALAGPWVIENLGGHWENYETPEQTWVWENARLHRHPSYTSSSDFVYGMTFQMRSGGHALDYFRLASPFVILGYTAQSWTEIAEGAIDWLDLPMLLSQSELATWPCSTNAGLAIVANDVSGSVDLQTFKTLFAPYGNSPGVAAIGAGTWRVTIAPGIYPVNIHGASVGSTTVLTFKFYRNDATGTPIATLTSDPITEDAVEPYQLQVPDVVLGEIPMLTVTPSAPDTLAMVLGVTTDSATPVDVIVCYNATNAIRVSIPRGVTPATLGPQGSDALFPVALTPAGLLAGFGAHRRLSVTAGGYQLKAIETAGLTGSPQLECVFADACPISPDETVTGGAGILTQQSTKGEWLKPNIKAGGNATIIWRPSTDAGGDDKWHLIQYLAG